MKREQEGFDPNLIDSEGEDMSEDGIEDGEDGHSQEGGGETTREAEANGVGTEGRGTASGLRD